MGLEAYGRAVMSREQILSEDDERLYRQNISLLEERVVANFRECYAAPEILSAIRTVPRHLFVAPTHRALAYTDNALPTARGLTTSAPSVIARMIFHARATRGSRVLEVGTGTGYQAALLAEMGAIVRSIELDGKLAGAAKRILTVLGYKRPLGSAAHGRGQVRLYRGNGMRGCPDGAPYDAIILAAAVPDLRRLSTLTAQLEPRGGRLVAPVGPPQDQQFVVAERRGATIRSWAVPGISLDFVRMVLPAARPTPRPTS